MSFNKPITDWSDRRVWIVGASSGIGAAIAKQLLAQGTRVALSARREGLLEEVAGSYTNALAVPLDVLEEGAWVKAYQEIKTLFGGLDLLLFCAADYRCERSWEVNAAVASRTFEINVGSMYRALATVLPTMLKDGNGGIGLIASVAGYMGLPNASVYGPTKAALINLAEILYGDLHPKGLDVYLINPGFVDTPLTEKNQFNMPALQTPEQAATSILGGISKGNFEIHFPHRFTMILKFVQLLPYRLRFLLLKRLV
jgi:short-subunit dehydrogenase